VQKCQTVALYPFGSLPYVRQSLCYRSHFSCYSPVRTGSAGQVPGAEVGFGWQGGLRQPGGPSVHIQTSTSSQVDRRQVHQSQTRPLPETSDKSPESSTHIIPINLGPPAGSIYISRQAHPSFVICYPPLHRLPVSSYLLRGS
jgi:hypothetical protein